MANPPHVEFSENDRTSWAFCPSHLSRDSVVYSGGIGRHIRFELWLISRFGCDVHALDPTPVALEWIATQRRPEQFRVHPVGISDHDGVQRFYLPRSPSSADFTSLPRDRKARKFIEAPVRRVSTLLTELGHSRLDLLKMDIEGGEYGVIRDLRDSRVWPSQLLVEFHHNFPSVPFRRTYEAIVALREAGYEIAHISPRGLEFLFVRRP